MYRDRLSESDDSKLGARRHVGALLDVNQATLRNWVEDAEQRILAGIQSGRRAWLRRSRPLCSQPTGGGSCG